MQISLISIFLPLFPSLVRNTKHFLQEGCVDLAPNFRAGGLPFVGCLLLLRIEWHAFV
jgi:hypothetical protein